MLFKRSILIETVTTQEYIHAHVWQMGAIFDLTEMICKYLLTWRLPADLGSSLSES